MSQRKSHNGFKCSNVVGLSVYLVKIDSVKIDHVPVCSYSRTVHKLYTVCLVSFKSHPKLPKTKIQKHLSKETHNKYAGKEDVLKLPTQELKPC